MGTPQSGRGYVATWPTCGPPLILGSRAAREALEYDLFLSIDFAKAFDSVHHNYCVASFQHLGLLATMISLIMSMLTSPFIFGVRWGVVHTVRPGSGVRQGDPLSPALFALVCSALVPMLQEVSPSIRILFCADDLLLYIPISPALVRPLITRIMNTRKRCAQFGLVPPATPLQPSW